MNLSECFLIIRRFPVLEVQGAGRVELADYDGTLTRIGLDDALYRAKTTCGGKVSYIAD